MQREVHSSFAIQYSLDIRFKKKNGIGPFQPPQTSHANKYILQPGFSFISETNGGKVLLEESLSPHNSKNRIEYILLTTKRSMQIYVSVCF